MSGKRVSDTGGVEEDYQKRSDAEERNTALLERNNYLKLASAAVATTAASDGEEANRQGSTSSE